MLQKKTRGFLTFVDGTTDVSVSFDAGENTYGGVLDISNPVSLSGFQALQRLLTGDLDHAVSPEDLAGVFETITSSDAQLLRLSSQLMMWWQQQSEQCCRG